MFGFKKKRIYLDYASAPPVLPEAEVAMRDAARFTGNPGAIHREGVEAKQALESARARIAALLECKAREIIFTSGLTESNNIAILGLARKLSISGSDLAKTHWIVSSIEHASVLDVFGEIERLGGKVTHVDPNERGIMQPESIERALRPETVLVSVGWANNELGTIQPLRDIARILRAYEDAHGSTMLLHADAGQAPLYLPTLIHSLGVDLLSIGSNKLYGPHGIGALYISKRADIVRIMLGGKQERQLRAGTENVALAHGFAAAYETVAQERASESERLSNLRNTLAKELEERIPELLINGDIAHALPHMLNVSIPHISSEYMTLALDHEGIAVSTKSACREGEESRSHAVEALGGPDWRAQNTLRFSLGRDTTDSDVQRVAEKLGEIVRRNKSV